MIIIPLTQESTNKDPVNVEVDAERSEGCLRLTVPVDAAHPDVDWRIITTDEARALAAALTHYAAEAER